MAEEYRDWRKAFQWGWLTSHEFAICTNLLGSAMRRPDVTISPDGKPYLYRWHVVPRNPVANVYLHVQVGPDAGRHVHDHPWDNQSVILSGGYIETVARRYGNGWAMSEHERKVGDVVHRMANSLHRLELAPGVKRSISLFSTGPIIREWGFDTPEGWRHHREMIDNDGNYSTLKEAA